MAVADPRPARALPLGALLGDALLAAILALALAVPLIGFETVDVSGGGLGLNYRF